MKHSKSVAVRAASFPGTGRPRPGPARAARAARAALRAAARAAVPALEPLEGRVLFANIVVTDLGDVTATDEKVTLREAIQAAETDMSVDGSTAGAGADTITFAAALTASADATITLAQ